MDTTLLESIVEEDRDQTVEDFGGCEEEDVNNTTKKKQKKKKHYFEHHIRKILKEICAERNITQRAKSQLNELAIIACKLIIDKVNHILNMTGKKTITTVELESAVKLVFTGQLAQKSVEEGHKCITFYSNSIKSTDLKGQSRHLKANILIPPSILENFLREGGGLHVSANSPIFLAGVIEYFLSQVLELGNNMGKKESVRLTIDDLENGIKSDKELNTFLTDNKIYLFESNIVPYIHPELKGKTGENDKKSMEIISKIQKDTGYIFPRTVIDHKFKNYISLVYPEIRYQKCCFSLFHDYIEKFMVEILQSANILTLMSGKNRVTGNDIEMVLSIIENRLPEFLTNLPDCGGNVPEFITLENFQQQK